MDVRERSREDHDVALLGLHASSLVKELGLATFFHVVEVDGEDEDTTRRDGVPRLGMPKVISFTWQSLLYLVSENAMAFHVSEHWVLESIVCIALFPEHFVKPTKKTVEVVSRECEVLWLTRVHSDSFVVFGETSGSLGSSTPCGTSSRMPFEELNNLITVFVAQCVFIYFNKIIH